MFVIVGKCANVLPKNKYLACRVDGHPSRCARVSVCVCVYVYIYMCVCCVCISERAHKDEQKKKSRHHTSPVSEIV